MIVLVILFACISVFIFSGLGDKTPNEKWNDTAATFSAATPTVTLAPAQGWWSNVATPTIQPIP